MKLLHLAHRGEAQAFLSELKMRPLMQGQVDLYSNDKLLLLIGGEGLFTSIEQVSFVLGRYLEIDEVINLGICGVLDEKLAKVGELYKVGSVYAYDGNGPQFTSYHSTGNIDLVTSSERVTTPELASKLKPMAVLVDRELWGVARACKMAGIPFQSFKLTSDVAGTEMCMDIKNRALEYSRKLLAFFLKNFKSEQHNTEDVNRKLELEIYCTKQQKIILHKLLGALCLKYNCDENTVLTKIDFTKYSALDITDKKRTNLILSELQDLLNPHKARVQQELQKFAASLGQIGAQVSFDPALEKKEFNLQMRINHQTNIEKLKLALNQTDFEKFNAIMEGRLSD